MCLWEDDGAAPWTVGGPNSISLLEGQQRYRSTGAAHPRKGRGRPPRSEETAAEDWQPVELTEEMLSLVAAAHASLEQDIAAAEAAHQAQGEDVFAEYGAAVTELRRQAAPLPYAEVKERFRTVSTRHGLVFPEAELELLTHLLQDERWWRHHPLQALTWSWRHRHSATLATRLRQLRTGAVRFAG